MTPPTVKRPSGSRGILQRERIARVAFGQHGNTLLDMNYVALEDNRKRVVARIGRAFAHEKVSFAHVGAEHCLSVLQGKHSYVHVLHILTENKRTSRVSLPCSQLKFVRSEEL